jgi:hypothetical protein
MHPMVYWVKRARVDMPFKLPLTMVPDVLLWITGTPYHAGFSPVLEATKHQSNYCSSLFKHITSSNNLFHPEKSPLIHLLTHCTPLVSGSECCIIQIIEQPVRIQGPRVLILQFKYHKGQPLSKGECTLAFAVKPDMVASHGHASHWFYIETPFPYLSNLSLLNLDTDNPVRCA